MNTYQKINNFLIFKFSYKQEIVDAIKQIERRKWDPVKKEWSIPILAINSKQIKHFIEKYNFLPLLTDDNSKINKIPTLIDEKSKVEVKSRLLGVPHLKFKPREYQEFAISYNLLAKRCINGDDVGLGKTLETIFTCELLDKWPVLIICPNSVKYHWKEYFMNEKRSVSVISSKNKDFNSDVVIINYDLLADTEKKEVNGVVKKTIVPKFKELLSIKWKVVVFDEIHLLKSNKSNRNKISRKVSKNVEHIFGLSGTLSVNKPVELIQPMLIIGRFNELFGNWDYFVRKYCNAKETMWGLDTSGSSNLEELNKILKSSCYYRREKTEVIKDMPSLQFSILDFSIDNKKEYNKAEGNFLDYIVENFPDGKIQSALMAEFLVLRNLLRQLSVKGKLKEIINWLEEWKENNKEKIVIFGIHKEPLLILSEHFKCDKIDGSVNPEEKFEIIKKFQKDNNPFLFGNIKSIGTGTDGLQNCCHTGLIIELPDTPAELEQAVGRLHRSGQKFPVDIFLGLSRETLDIDMWEVLEEKRKITDMINKGIEVKERSFDQLLLKNFLVNK